MKPPPSYNKPLPPPHKEEEFEFKFAGAASVRKHDDELPGTPAVDFYVDFPGEIWLIECKDPECSTIPPKHQANQLTQFISKMQSGQLVFEDLIRKLQCSCNAIHSFEKVPQKPFRYLVVIGYAKATTGEFSVIRDAVVRLMRRVGPPGKYWDAQFTVEVLNIARWNQRFPTRPLQRVP